MEEERDEKEKEETEGRSEGGSMRVRGDGGVEGERQKREESGVGCR